MCIGKELRETSFGMIFYEHMHLKSQGHQSSNTELGNLSNIGVKILIAHTARFICVRYLIFIIDFHSRASIH